MVPVVLPCSFLLVLHLQPYCPASYPSCFHSLPLTSSPPGSLSPACPCSPFSPAHTHTFSSLACNQACLSFPHSVLLPGFLNFSPSLMFHSPCLHCSCCCSPSTLLPLPVLLVCISLSCCLCHRSSPLSTQLISYPSLCASVLLPFPLCSFAVSALLHTAVSPFSISVPLCTSLSITVL